VTSRPVPNGPAESMIVADDQNTAHHGIPAVGFQLSLHTAFANLALRGRIGCVFLIPDADSRAVCPSPYISPAPDQPACSAMQSRSAASHWCECCDAVRPARSSLTEHRTGPACLHANEHKCGAGRCDGTQPQIVLVNARRRPHPELIFDAHCGWRTRMFCPFQAGDGFGFGLSSTEWIFIGTHRG